MSQKNNSKQLSCIGVMTFVILSFLLTLTRKLDQQIGLVIVAPVPKHKTTPLTSAAALTRDADRRTVSRTKDGR